MVAATGLAADCGLCDWCRVGAGTEFLDLEEPVIPPFPMSDYGTGCAGAIAALTGLYKRATEGRSWWGGVSLIGYNVDLLSLGLYPP